MKQLNFGCGNDIRPDWDNCDIQEGLGVTSFDFDKFPYPIKDDTYDYIDVRQVINFMDKPDDVLFELWRIAKKNATIRILVPWWHNKGAYNDIQTKHWFNEHSFDMFANQTNCRIDTKKKFELVKLEKIPTVVGMFMFKWLREKLDLFIGGLIANMEVELRVMK